MPAFAVITFFITFDIDTFRQLLIIIIVDAMPPLIHPPRPRFADFRLVSCALR